MLLYRSLSISLSLSVQDAMLMLSSPVVDLIILLFYLILMDHGDFVFSSYRETFHGAISPTIFCPSNYAIR